MDIGALIREFIEQAKAFILAYRIPVIAGALLIFILTFFIIYRPGKKPVMKDEAAVNAQLATRVRGTDEMLAACRILSTRDNTLPDKIRRYNRIERKALLVDDSIFSNDGGATLADEPVTGKIKEPSRGMRLNDTDSALIRRTSITNKRYELEDVRKRRGNAELP